MLRVSACCTTRRRQLTSSRPRSRRAAASHCEMRHAGPDMWRASGLLALMLCFTLAGGGCERRLRARERQAAEAAARQRSAPPPPAQPNEPLPEEPPVELRRVADSGLPCDVDQVFALKCRRCHTIPTRHGAPLVFLTWDDVQKDRAGDPIYKVIGRVVRSGFMPYRVEANPPVEPLDESEKKIILDWVDAGAPRQDCAAAAASSKSASPAPAERPKKSTPPRAPSAGPLPR